MYMHKPESIRENETHKILWDLEIQTDHLIPARRPDLVIVNKKKINRSFRIVNFSILADYSENQRKRKKKTKKPQYLDLAES